MNKGARLNLFKIIFPVNGIFEEYFLTPETTYLVMWKNILPHVHG
jgi:hypothetical protein